MRVDFAGGLAGGAISLAFGAALVLGACSKASASGQGARTPSEVQRFFPLHDGYVYTYQTIREGASDGDMFMLRVQRTDPQHARLLTGSTSRSMSVNADSIARDEGGFVLRSPLREGATWPGDNGGTTVVEATGVREQVAAGTYSGCIRTREQVDGARPKTIRTVFCPDVGITSMTVEAAHDSQRAELRSFGPPVDLEAGR